MGGRSRAGGRTLALKLLAPYLAVLIFWVGLHSAWLAILAYHLQAVFWLWRDRRRLGKLPPAGLLALALPATLAGPVAYLVLPRVAVENVGSWLASFGLSGGSLSAMVLYFGLIHPCLEQMHWAPLRQSTGWAHPLFAGYHMVVLASLLPLGWLAVSFALLIGASWAWKWMEAKGAGLLTPVASHVLADSSIGIAALLMVRTSL